MAFPLIHCGWRRMGFGGDKRRLLGRQREGLTPAAQARLSRNVSSTRSQRKAGDSSATEVPGNERLRQRATNSETHQCWISSALRLSRPIGGACGMDHPGRQRAFPARSEGRLWHGGWVAWWVAWKVDSLVNRHFRRMIYQRHLLTS